MPNIFSKNAIFVTGGNDTYAGLMAECIHSLRSAATKSGIDPNQFSIGVIDAGLTAKQIEYFKSQNCIVVSPDWPDCIPYARRKDAPSFLKACVWRPYLPQLFKGYDKIISVDADVWCQDFSSFLMFDQSSNDGSCAITLNIDRSYGKQMRVKWLGMFPIKISGFYMSNARKALGYKQAQKLFNYPVASAGIFAARSDSDLWTRWQEWMEKICVKGNLFTAEQVSLGFAIHVDKVPAKFLPSYTHWIASYPMLYCEDRKLFLEPNPPYEIIGNLHLSGIDDVRANREATLPITTLSGKSIGLNLRYPDFDGESEISKL
jgi:hypothetical protein